MSKSEISRLPMFKVTLLAPGVKDAWDRASKQERDKYPDDQPDSAKLIEVRLVLSTCMREAENSQSRRERSRSCPFQARLPHVSGHFLDNWGFGCTYDAVNNKDKCLADLIEAAAQD